METAGVKTHSDNPITAYAQCAEGLHFSDFSFLGKLKGSISRRLLEHLRLCMKQLKGI